MSVSGHSQLLYQTRHSYISRVISFITVCASKFPRFCVHVNLTSLLFVCTETLSANSKAVDDNCLQSKQLSSTALEQAQESKL